MLSTVWSHVFYVTSGGRCELSNLNGFFWIFWLLVFCKSFQLHQRLYIFGIIFLESNGRKKNRKKRSSNVEHFSFILIDCYSRRVCYSRHSTKKSIYLLLYPYSILPLHSFCSFHFISVHFFLFLNSFIETIYVCIRFL